MSESNGTFWEASSPIRSRGHYAPSTEGRPELRLLAPIVDDPLAARVATNDGTSRIVSSMQADKAVKSFAPILIHGELDTGENLTLLSAQNYSAGPTLPRYRARVSILGAHVDANHAYSAMRFRVSDRYWTDHLSPGESAQTADLSTLRTEAAEDGIWLIYEGASHRNIRDLEQYVANSCITLMTLAFDFRPEIQEIELRTHDGPWLRTAGSGFRGQTSDWDVPMLNTSELTLERIARWIDLNAALDNLGAASADPPTGAVQAQALVATTLLEGIHRRLPFEQSKFPSLSKAAKRKVRAVARSAAVEAATSSAGVDVGAVDKAISDCLSHFSSVSYLDRAHDIVAEVGAAVPELTMSVPDLPKLLKDARNDLAHHLVEAESIDELVTVISRWTIASMAAPWLLRFLLLLRVGVDPAILRSKSLEHQRFEFVLANIARIADELGGATD